MKNITVLFVVMLVVSAFDTLAQPFETNSNVAGVGLGIGGYRWGVGRYGSQTPGVSFQYERGVWDVPGPGVVSLGGYLGVKGFRYEYMAEPFWHRASGRYTVLGLRSAYHYNGHGVEPLDLYGGAMLSYDAMRYRYTGNDPYLDYGRSYNGRPGLSLYIGGRYYVIPNMAVYTEIGYGISYLTLGGAYQF